MAGHLNGVNLFKMGRIGLRAVLEPGTKTGQGHADQWLAILAQAGLSPEQTIAVPAGTFTIADLVRQVQRDVPRNVDREWSWTLIGLTSYLPTNATWEGGDEQTWSIERLVGEEASQPLESSACGGTHRLIGLSMALNRHLAQEGSLAGPWQDADRIIAEAIARTEAYQDGSGAFSAHYFERPGITFDLAQALGTSGHTLELLALALPTARVGEPWVARGADYLCDLFDQTADYPLECGALYHALHGLAVYRQRL